MVEIDRFDALVEKLGQPVGDQLIQQFRAVLSKRVRLEDTVSQTGPAQFTVCLLYTSDAADERSSVDLGGRRIIKKKNTDNYASRLWRI